MDRWRKDLVIMVAINLVFMVVDVSCEHLKSVNMGLAYYKQYQVLNETLISPSNISLSALFYSHIS